MILHKYIVYDIFTQMLDYLSVRDHWWVQYFEVKLFCAFRSQTVSIIWAGMEKHLSTTRCWHIKTNTHKLTSTTNILKYNLWLCTNVLKELVPHVVILTIPKTQPGTQKRFKFDHLLMLMGAYSTLSSCKNTSYKMYYILHLYQHSSKIIIIFFQKNKNWIALA